MTEEIKACEKCKLFDIEKTNRDLLERINELEQENEKLKEENVKLLFGKGALIKLCDNLTKIIDEKKEKESKLWQVLEEIRIIATKNVSIESFVKIQNKINEVLE